MASTIFGEFWTGEELQFLIDHYGKPGCGYKWLSDNKPGIYRSPSAVSRKINYLGLAKAAGRRGGSPAIIPRIKDDVADMAIMGYSCNRIAAEIKAQHGIGSKKTVLRIINNELPANIRLAWIRGKKERRSIAGKMRHQRRAA